MKREHLTLLVVALGFLTTFVEVRYLHRFVIHEEPIAWTPVIATPLLAIACFFAMAKGGFLRTLGMFLLGIGAVAGVVGFYFHTEGFERERMMPYFTEGITRPATVSIRNDEGEPEEGVRGAKGEKEGREEVPPLFAPLGITGLALVGLIAGWKGRRSG